MRKIALALQTLMDVAQNKNGFKSSEDLSQFRMKVCESCPNYKDGKCGVCGCFMNIKTKLGSASCPEGYWEQKQAEYILFGEVDKEYIQHECCGDN